MKDEKQEFIEALEEEIIFVAEGTRLSWIITVFLLYMANRYRVGRYLLRMFRTCSGRTGVATL